MMINGVILTTEEIEHTKNRLKSKMINSTTNDCILWTGSIWNKTGRPRIKVKKIYVSVYRLIFELYIKDINSSYVIHHTCSNFLCVNIEHLQEITQENNTAEMLERQSYIKEIARLKSLLDCNNISY